ncbi:hypothetical protein LCGC14_1490320 [marine sediment metagenome]|uniref:Uncharacterized protein n=1 Tax=marine sediment metagenome TaxID=412755 RepID=A0A0F9M8M9_9ZZZZ
MGMTELSINIDATDITVACPYTHDQTRSLYEGRCVGSWDFPCDGSRWGKVDLNSYLEWPFRQVTEKDDADK